MTETLAVAFDPRWNSLNALRLLFACLVIVSHAFTLGGFGVEPSFGGSTLGGWAVAGFFVISGYLITRSRFRSELRPFVVRRFLRLYPGLWVCLLVTVLVFVPIAALREPGTFPPDLGGVLSFVVWNATIFAINIADSFGIPGTLETVPYAGSWNGSLWTLPYEEGCYVVIAVVGSVFAVARARWVLLIGFVVVSVVHVTDETLASIPIENVQVAVMWLMYFLAGAVLFLLAERIPAAWWLAAAAAVFLFVLGLVGQAAMLGALPFAYLCMWAGIRLPIQRIGRANDISYGVYIYAFPIQQLLVLYGLTRVGVGFYIIVAILFTLVAAALSWKLVEQPAMRRGRRLRSHGPHDSEPATTLARS